MEHLKKFTLLEKSNNTITTDGTQIGFNLPVTRSYCPCCGKWKKNRENVCSSCGFDEENDLQSCYTCYRDWTKKEMIEQRCRRTATCGFRRYR